MQTNSPNLTYSKKVMEGNVSIRPDAHLQWMRNKKITGGRKKKGGACCGSTSKNIVQYASSSTGSHPTANENLATSAQHLANMNCASSGDSTDGWSNLKGGSALGGFIENLNNIKGGTKRRRKRYRGVRKRPRTRGKSKKRRRTKKRRTKRRRTKRKKRRGRKVTRKKRR